MSREVVNTKIRKQFNEVLGLIVAARERVFCRVKDLIYKNY